jgi:hypothetical protein
LAEAAAEKSLRPRLKGIRRPLDGILADLRATKPSTEWTSVLTLDLRRAENRSEKYRQFWLAASGANSEAIKVSLRNPAGSSSRRANRRRPAPRGAAPALIPGGALGRRR